MLPARTAHFLPSKRSSYKGRINHILHFSERHDLFFPPSHPGMAATCAGRGMDAACHFPNFPVSQAILQSRAILLVAILLRAIGSGGFMLPSSQGFSFAYLFVPRLLSLSSISVLSHRPGTRGGGALALWPPALFHLLPLAFLPRFIRYLLLWMVIAASHLCPVAISRLTGSNPCTSHLCARVLPSHPLNFGFLPARV